MIGFSIALAAAIGIAAGPVAARMRHAGWRRFGGWLLVSALVAAMHGVLLEADPVLRMVGLCVALLGGMKGLVYAEWAGRKRLPLSRYLVFSVLWFGMNPGDFVRRLRGLSWKRDVGLGVAMMVIGTLGAWWVWLMEWRHILVMFVPMSLGFHFGALRVLKGGLRLAGFPVRTLFPNPLAARGIGDFWSRRWNTGYSQMMQRNVGRPVAGALGAPAGLMAVFVVSGLLHELAITLPVQAGYGLPTLFFVAHGLLTLLEQKMGKPFGRIPALLLVMLPIGLLFPPAFQTEVICRCLDVFTLWL